MIKSILVNKHPVVIALSVVASLFSAFLLNWKLSLDYHYYHWKLLHLKMSYKGRRSQGRFSSKVVIHWKSLGISVEIREWKSGKCKNLNGNDEWGLSMTPKPRWKCAG